MIRSITFASVIGVALSQVASAAEPNVWQPTVAKATSFLVSRQNADGSWGEAPRNLGITGIVVTGLLQSGQTADDPAVAKGLKFIEGLVNVKAGHIAGADPKVNLQNYYTCVNLMALAAAKRDAAYKPVIGDATNFLKRLQWDDGEGKSANDDFFGGAGYDSKSRPDLSNTQFFLDALRAANVPPSDESFKKALVFVSRCQNLPGEHNDRAWAGKIGDGSFIYSAAAGGQTKTSDEPNAPLTGYGSMTYAGIKSMIYCGVGKDDPRMKKAIEWIQKNYTLEANPGMPPQLANRGLYYYYHTMSKTLELLGEDQFTDARGVKHDWRAELTAKLASLQLTDGSWKNATDRWMEGDPVLVTAYCLMSLGHTRSK
jgi:squalene-hopene/tetraprenyl-beta-curcumene cyclase